MKSIKIIALVLLAALLASCAGLGSGVKEDDVFDVIEKLNRGESEALIERSVLPFVFDAEILESETQLKLLWSGLSDAGYIIDDPIILQQRPVSADDALIFSENWEIKTYFKNLLSESDTFVEIKGNSQHVYMVLRPKKSGVKIAVFKGVQK